MTDKTIDQLDANTGLVRTDMIELWDASAAATVQGTLAEALALALSTDISDSSVASRAIITAVSNAAIKALLDLEIGIDLQAYGQDLTAIEALSGTGSPARTADNTWALRTLSGDTGVTITNGAGVAGNPTISLHAMLVALAGLASDGIISRTAAGTLAARTLQDATGLTWTNPAGIAGNPTPALHAALAALAQTASADKVAYYTSASAASLMDFTSVARTLVAASTTAAQRSAMGVHKFAVAAFLEAPIAKTYTFMRRPGFAFTINNMISRMNGTATLNAKIGATSITGLSAVAATSTETTTAATAANSVTATDRLDLTVTSPVTATDLSVTFECTRA
jgi:hypothetical protein